MQTHVCTAHTSTAIMDSFMPKTQRERDNQLYNGTLKHIQLYSILHQSSSMKKQRKHHPGEKKNQFLKLQISHVCVVWGFRLSLALTLL